jgi:hypothetical protein
LHEAGLLLLLLTAEVLAESTLGTAGKHTRRGLVVEA